MTLKFGHKDKFVFTISILLLTDLAILLDIPFLRQIFGFLFLTILPGLLILQILKLNKLELTEKFVLSVGLSISFLMFFGLLLNNLSLSLGYETPLSTIYLLISFNVAIVTLAIIAYKQNKNSVFSLPNLNLSTSEKAFLIVPIFFPVLSILGINLMNMTDNNIILMLLLFLIPIYVAFVCFFNKKFPKRLYPVVIFSISISLLLLMSLRSNHIIGIDTHVEFFFFKSTLDHLHWAILEYILLDACLAISLLPTIYQSILNISPEFLFKILHSLIFSVAPLIIYIISKKYIGESYAFLASIFFVFQEQFLWTAPNARTNIAILFVALAVMILFNDKIDPLKKRIFFIVFFASCMVSHYSTTYIFFFILLGTFVGTEILSTKYTFKKVISLTTVLLFFAMIFFWYSQITEGAFDQGINYISNTLSNLNNFFVEELKAESLQSLSGKDITQRGAPYIIHFLFTWLMLALIAIGIVTLIRRYKEMSFPELGFRKMEFLKEKFEVVYFVIVLICSGLLVVMITFPYISLHYGLHRLFGVVIPILSVFFVIGGITIAKNLSLIKKILLKSPKNERKGVKECGRENPSPVWAYVIILFVLIPNFLCIFGVMYNIFGVPRSIILNSEGEEYDRMYVNDRYIIAGEWLSSCEVVRGRLVNKQKTIGNMTEYLSIFDEKNRIYDNGGSEVWR